LKPIQAFADAQAALVKAEADKAVKLQAELAKVQPLATALAGKDPLSLLQKAELADKYAKFGAPEVLEKQQSEWSKIGDIYREQASKLEAMAQGKDAEARAKEEAAIASAALANAKSSELDELKKAIEEMKTQQAQEKRQMMAERALTSLDAELLKRNVDPELLPTVRPFFMAQGIKPVGEGADFTVVVGKGKDVVPLETYLDGWAKTNPAKVFIRAPVSTGGAAPQGSEAPTNNTVDMYMIAGANGQKVPNMTAILAGMNKNDPLAIQLAKQQGWA
jgi:hypothetical protein